MFSDDGFSDKGAKNITEEVLIMEELSKNDKEMHDSSVLDIDADEMIMSILSPEGLIGEDSAIRNKKAMYLNISRLNCNDGSSSDEEESFNTKHSANDTDNIKLEPEELEDDTESLSNNYTSLVNCNDCDDDDFGDFSESIPNAASIRPDFDDSNADEQFQFADFESNAAINIPSPVNSTNFVSIPPLSEGKSTYTYVITYLSRVFIIFVNNS